MCCIILDASHVFVYCSFSNAPVDALAGIPMRDALSQVPILVHLLATSTSLFVVIASIQTTVVTMGVLPAIVDGRTATTMSAESRRSSAAMSLVRGNLRIGDGLDPFEQSSGLSHRGDEICSYVRSDVQIFWSVGESIKVCHGDGHIGA